MTSLGASLTQIEARHAVKVRRARLVQENVQNIELFDTEVRLSSSSL